MAERDRSGSVDPNRRPREAAGPTMQEPGVRVHWRSEQLFGPLDEVQIAHGPFVYRLRKTSLGKLILTK